MKLQVGGTYRTRDKHVRTIVGQTEEISTDRRWGYVFVDNTGTTYTAGGRFTRKYKTAKDLVIRVHDRSREEIHPGLFVRLWNKVKSR